MGLDHQVTYPDADVDKRVCYLDPAAFTDPCFVEMTQNSRWIKRRRESKQIKEEGLSVNTQKFQRLVTFAQLLPLHLQLSQPNLFLLQKVRFSVGAAPSVMPRLTRRSVELSVHHTLL